MSDRYGYGFNNAIGMYCVVDTLKDTATKFFDREDDAKKFSESKNKLDKGVDRMSELPVLIKRCLVFGIVILPSQLNYILRGYNNHTIPEDDLNKLNKAELENYVKALYLSSQEMSIDWVAGHDMLLKIGFSKVEIREGHRAFVSLVYDTDSKIKLENKE